MGKKQKPGRPDGKLTASEVISVTDDCSVMAKVFLTHKGVPKHLKEQAETLLVNIGRLKQLGLEAADAHEFLDACVVPSLFYTLKERLEVIWRRKVENFQHVQLTFLIGLCRRHGWVGGQTVERFIDSELTRLDYLTKQGPRLADGHPAVLGENCYAIVMDGDPLSLNRPEKIVPCGFVQMSYEGGDAEGVVRDEDGAEWEVSTLDCFHFLANAELECKKRNDAVKKK
jgi:hypothetical protein